MKESTVEDHLLAEAKRLGGIAIKIAPLSAVGLPDRLVLLPGGRVGFLELKRPGKTPGTRQVEWLARLGRLGVPAAWADSKAGVDAFLRNLQGLL